MKFSIKVIVIKNDHPENFSIPFVAHVIVTIVRISYIIEYLITHVC